MKTRLWIITSIAINLLLFSCSALTPETTNVPTSAQDTLVPSSALTKTPTLSPTSSPTLTSTTIPSPTPTPRGGSVAVLAGNLDCQGHSCVGSTFLINLDTGRKKLIGGENYLLEDISPDNQALLLSEGTNLYITDLLGNVPVLLSSNFVGHSDRIPLDSTAYWLNSGEIVFVGNEGSQRDIYLVNPDGSDLRSISKSSLVPHDLKRTQGFGVIWEEGWIEPKGFVSQGLLWMSLNDETIIPLDHANSIAVSPMGDYLVYTDGISQDQNLIILDLQTKESRQITPPFVSDNPSGINKIIWFPDGQNLLVIHNICRPLGGGNSICDEYQVQMIDLEGNEVKEFPDYFSLYNQLTWSPDGHHLLIDGWKIFDIDTFSLEILSVDIFAKRLFWVPSDTYPWFSGSKIPTSPIDPRCAGVNKPFDCCEYYFVEESLSQGIYYWYRSFPVSEDSRWEVKSFDLMNSGTDEMLSDNIFLYDARHDRYTVSIPIDGEIVQFHGLAQINSDSDVGEWVILLDENVPPGVDRELFTNSDLSRFTWELPDGKAVFIQVNKSCFVNEGD